MKKLLALATGSMMMFALSTGVSIASPEPNCMGMNTKECGKLLSQQKWTGGWKELMRNVSSDAKNGEKGQKENYAYLKKMYSKKKSSSKNQMSKDDKKTKKDEKAMAPSGKAMSKLSSYDKKIRSMVSERNKLAAKAGHYKLVLMAAPPKAKKGSKGENEEGKGKLMTLKEAEARARNK